jgi:V/A-type H+-transporting ATPase subunit D
MSTSVSPTRIERSNQIAREKTARRGHKLLKDKSTEMRRRLLEIEKQIEPLREKVEAELERGMNYFLEARVKMSEQELENAISCFGSEFFVIEKTQSVMGLSVPHYELVKDKEEKQTILTTTPTSFDRALKTMTEVVPKIVQLASMEKTYALLKEQIETLNRRINALEYSVIPTIQENIKVITMKLAENERSNIVRLMKVKEMIEKR